MARIEGLEQLVDGMRSKAAAVFKEADASVLVGYTAAYAIYVHENREPKHAGEPRPSGLGVYWGPSGRPGFLLDVFREMKAEIASIVKRAVRAGQAIIQALLLGGLRLQRESMLNVPVEYGNLRASAFTRLETR